MITLEQLLKEERDKKEIILPKTESERIDRVLSKIDDPRFKDVRSQSASNGWWDGPAEYQFVNRNIVSCLQRDMLFYITQALCKHLGIGLGIGGTPISGVLHVNTGNTCDIVVTDHNLPLEDNSVGYIISSHTLEHIPNTDAVLNEWLRVLKPNGLIAITMPDKRYFTHENRDGISKYDYAYCEMDPSELKSHIDKILDRAELLLFDTNQNGFDMNALIRKRG